MSEIISPASWKTGTISCIADINPTVRLNGLSRDIDVSFVSMSDVDENGRLKTPQTRRLEEVLSGFTRFQENDVLFAKITPCMQNGKGCLARNLTNGVGLGSTEFHVLRAKDGGCADFIFQLMQSATVRENAIGYFSGSAGQQRVSSDFFTRYQINIPPLPEQRKIARILTTLDKVIEMTEALIAKYESIKQGMMHDLFTRGIDANGSLRPTQQQAPHLYKQSELGWIPKDWEVPKVKEVGCIQLGRQRSPKHQSGKYTTPYLRVANVFDGYFDFSDVLEMDFTPNEKQLYDVQPGDILLNEGQSIELVGRCALYTGQPHIFCFQNTLIRFRVHKSTDAQYCREVFKRWLDTGVFITIASQTTSVAHLGASRFGNLRFPYPPLDEQKGIANRLNRINNFLKVEEDKNSKLKQTKSGLMQDLLTGKMRVKIDEIDKVGADV